MATESEAIGAGRHAALKTALRRLGIISILVALCLFFPAGTLAWTKGWIFLISYVLVLITLTGLVFQPSPELVRERMRAAPKAKSWDRILVPMLAMVLPLLAIILTGLDHRLGWTRDMGMIATVIAFVVMMGGSALTMWAMRVNRFFSSHVRIQTDRGHHVVDHGPYRWVRHPGYTGSIMYNVAMPVFLGSVPALAVGIIFTLLMAVRTALEDATLRTELAGYADYAHKTRWRLLPFFW